MLPRVRGTTQLIRRRSFARVACLLALGAAAVTAPAAAAASAQPPNVGPLARPAAADAPIAPVSRRGATVAQVVAPVVARVRPDARARAVWNVPIATGWSEQSQVLLVLQSHTDESGRRWLQVELPIRPNGTTGWIPDDYVRLATTRYWIDVDLRKRLVTIFRDGRPARRFAAVIGRPSTPTPRGLFAVWEMNRQPDPGGFLGPWAVPITALSNVLERYGGGPGRVAIHGRAGASFRDPLRSARSHGCIRVDNSHIVWLVRHVPRGTPVEIH
jgi:lipoprotein-anchoring transpeptidase ErfK/SrfK